MDHKLYYDAVHRMQKANVDPEYVQGWVGGFMGNPKREEQRITEAYEAGYAAVRVGKRRGSSNGGEDEPHALMVVFRPSSLVIPRHSRESGNPGTS